MANIPKVWNGTAFIELEAAATVGPAASTTVVGMVQLSDSTSSTSTTTAATPNSVKSAFDLAGTAIPKNTLTTTGDILYASGSATVARLGIGTASQVLSVSGGVPAWTTPASGGGMTLIATATPNAATSISFTSIPGTYKHLLVVVAGAYNSVVDTSWSLRLNNSGSDYYWAGVATLGSNDVGAGDNQDALPGLGYHVHSPISRTSTVSSAYQRHARSDIWIYRYAEPENTSVMWRTTGWNSGSGHSTALCFGQWRDTTAVNRVDLVRSSTQTVTGTIYLYGVS